MALDHRVGGFILFGGEADAVAEGQDVGRGGGLALGAFVAGRMVRRRGTSVRVYAGIELLIGATALADRLPFEFQQPEASG